MSCSAVFCASRTTKQGVKVPELSFHSFPKCPEIRTQWIKAVRREKWEPPKYARLCSKHFEKSSFVAGLSIIKLKSDAVPTIFEGYPKYYQPKVAKKRKRPDKRDTNLEITPRRWRRIEECGANTADIPNTPSLQFNTTVRHFNICCACLLSDVKMFQLSQHGLAHKMESMTGLEALDERVPMQLCYQCTAIVNKFYFFKQKCIRANNCLKEHVSKQPNKHELTLERDNLNLHSALGTTLTSTLEINPKLDSGLQNGSDSGGDEVIEDLPLLVKIEELEPENGEGFGGIVELIYEKRDQDEVPPNRLELEGNLELSSHMIEVNNEVVIEQVTGSRERQRAKCVKRMDVEGFGDIVELIYEKRDQDEIPPNQLKLEGNSELSSHMIEVNHEVATEQVTGSRERQRAKCVKRKDVEAKKDNLAKRKPRNTPKPKTAPSAASRCDCSSFSTELMLSRDEQLREVNERCSSLNYTNSPFKCLYCFKGFLDQGTYANHMVKHDESRGEHVCNICRYRYHSRRSLRSHVVQHQRRFKCNKCDYVSSNRWQAVTHNKWHEGILYSCPHCNMTFRIRSTVMNHIREKHPSNHVCAQCGETFQSPHGLTMHQDRSHLALEKATVLAGTLGVPNGTPGATKSEEASEERRCEKCAVTFASNAAYDRHLVTSSNHALIKKRKKVLYHTKRRTKQRAKLAIPGPVTCGICGKGFKTHIRYEYHMRTLHTDGTALGSKREGTKRPAFMCDLCGKWLTSKNILDYHIRTHTGEKPFKCDECDRAFRAKQQRDDHFILRHTTEKRHECPTCKLRFNSAINMTRHTAVHSELRPFTCELCDKTFKTYKSIFCHKKNVHLKKKYNKMDDSDSMNSAAAVSEGFKMATDLAVNR